MDRRPELAPQERAHLLSRYGQAYAAGEAIYREGDTADGVFLLQEGRVRLVKKVRSADRTLALVNPGDLFGESALVDSSARRSSALALTDTVAFAFDRATFRELLEHHPAVAIRVTEQLVKRLRDVEEQVEVLLLDNPQSRVVGALLRMADRGHSSIEWTPSELALRVGVDVNAVRKAVQRLRDQDYVRLVGERIEIRDAPALRRLDALLGTKEAMVTGSLASEG